MYVGKILGKEIKLWNIDYRALKKKWHPDNVVEHWVGSRIPGRCSLCRYECIDCPLGIFKSEKGTYKRGCGQVIDRVLRGKFIPHVFSFSDISGTTLKTKVETTKRYMQKIQDMLDTFEKK